MSEPAVADREETWALLFGVRRSIRYHNRRRNFFDGMHRLSNALGIIFGSAAIVGVIGLASKLYPSLAAAIVTIFSTIDLVVGSSTMARLHSDLSRRFSALEKEMTLTGELTEEELRKFWAERLDIEADEPPTLRILNLMCDNELRLALYNGAELYRIKWYQRILAHLINLDDQSIKKTRENE